MKARKGWAAIFGAFLLLGCDPSREGWEAGRPRIDDLEFLQQAPGDALGLIFRIEFADDDGDLGKGSIELFIDGDMRAGLSATELFAAQTPALSQGSVSGELEIIVRLDAEVTDGAEFEVGFELVDAAGNRSNRPSVTLAAGP